MLTRKELHDALEQGKEVVMFKYKQFGCWSAPKKVSKEVALHKSQICVFNSYGDCYCPYGFQLAQETVRKKNKKSVDKVINQCYNNYRK